MTQIPNSFWTNTKVNLTKPELSVTFNSYNLQYDVYFMNAENKPQSIPQGNQKNMVNYPKIPSAVTINKKECGSMWTDAWGNSNCDNCDSSGSDGACPYDNLFCPSDKVFLGKILSGNERGDCKPDDKWDKTKCCGSNCQSAQLVFCGVPNLECSITVGSGNCISNSN